MLEPTPSPNSPDAPAPEGRRSRRRRELHESILETAAELFARDGYDATTVEKIALAADIAPATFFNHFPSKEDVLREVGQDVFTRFRRLVEEQIARDVRSPERLDGFAARSADLVRRAPEMTRRVLIAVLRSSRPGESGNELASMQEDFVRLLAHDDDLPADLNRELAAEILVSVVIGCMTHWINNPDYPLQTRMRESLSLVGSRLLVPGSGGAHAQPNPTTARVTKTTGRPVSSRSNNTASTAPKTSNSTASRASKAGPKPTNKRKNP